MPIQLKDIQEPVAAEMSEFEQKFRKSMRSNVMLHDLPCPFRKRCPVMIEGKCDSEPAPRREMGHKHVVYCQHTEQELMKAQDHV